MYDLFLPPSLKGLRRFPACYKFLDNFTKIWIKFGFEEKWNGIPHTQVYFQRGCINITNSNCLSLKSVIEALIISSELQFSTDLSLACTHLQYLFTTFILPKSIYLLLQTIYLFLFHIPTKFIVNKEKTFLSGDLLILYNVILWNISFPGWCFLVFYGL